MSKLEKILLTLLLVCMMTCVVQSFMYRSLNPLMVLPLLAGCVIIRVLTQKRQSR
ncbi:hypothetical protein [Saccharibacillus sp. O23]|uniref:hypothetical protein n=1 Tax=Saccharibacillus sp. O23 TaxID=2009338 RepID=UPI0015C5EB69|nr:hypothetical protein [Saccharibacillus sp. O23]